jgi:catechol 2,3-dioxygenase-like lactoylglutathione lyase family enzyme
MIEGVSHIGVWVRDQDEAKSFYTEKLGMEVRQDATLDDLGGYRWLTVGPPGQPDVNIILSVPGPPAMDQQTADRLNELLAKGTLGPGILRTDDCRKTCQELESRGVEIGQQPEERFYGIDATVRDPSGNEWRLVEPVEFDLDAMQQSSSSGQGA